MTGLHDLLRFLFTAVGAGSVLFSRLRAGRICGDGPFAVLVNERRGDNLAADGAGPCLVTVICVGLMSGFGNVRFFFLRSSSTVPVNRPACRSLPVG